MKINKLHYISQKTANGSHLDAIEEVLKSGGKWIQLRIKEQSEENVLELALLASALCKSHGAKLIINDYPHIAKEAGADGVHLGLQDMSVRDAREILGRDYIIGGTANTFEDILKRVSEGADYIGLGPYRFTKTKSNLSPILGLPGYQRLMKNVQEADLEIPIIAIGGIEAEDVKELMKTGIYGLAVSGALTNQSLTVQKIQRIKEQIKSVKLTC
jgi:thiamine-phosphate pyrophosphorylase